MAYNDVRTPEAHAAATGNSTLDPQTNEIEYSAGHLAAAQLHGWEAHKRATTEPFTLLEGYYLEAIVAALAGNVPYESALSPYAAVAVPPPIGPGKHLVEADADQPWVTFEDLELPVSSTQVFDYVVRAFGYLESTPTTRVTETAFVRVTRDGSGNASLLSVASPFSDARLRISVGTDDITIDVRAHASQDWVWDTEAIRQTTDRSISLLTPSGTVARATASMPERFGYASGKCVTPEMHGADHANATPWNDGIALRAAALAVMAAGGGVVKCTGHYYAQSFDLTGLTGVIFDCEGATFEQSFVAYQTLPIFDLTGSNGCKVIKATFTAMAWSPCAILLARGSGTGYQSCNGNDVIDCETTGGYLVAPIVQYGDEDTNFIRGKYVVNGSQSKGALLLSSTDTGGVTSHVALHSGSRPSSLRHNYHGTKFVVGVSESVYASCITIDGNPSADFDACATYSADNETAINHFNFVATDALNGPVRIRGNHLFEGNGTALRPSRAVYLSRVDDGRANTYYANLTVENCHNSGDHCDWIIAEHSSVVASRITFQNNTQDTGTGDLSFGLLVDSRVDTKTMGASAGVTVSGGCYGNKFRVGPKKLTISDAAWLDRSNTFETTDGTNLFDLGRVERQIVQDLKDHYGAANVLQVWFAGGATFNGNSHATSVTALIGANLTGTDGSAWHAGSHNGRAALVQTDANAAGLSETTLSGALSVCCGAVGSSGGTVAYETMFDSAVSPYSVCHIMRSNTASTLEESGGQQHYVNGVDTATIPSAGLMIIEGNVATNTEAGGAWFGDVRGTRAWLGKALFGRALSIQPTAADVAWEYRLWLKYCSYFSDG